MKTKIIEFLKQLDAAQEKTLKILQEKQILLVKPESKALAKVAEEEVAAMEQLRLVLEKREEILLAAGEQGTEVESVQELCETLFPNNFEVRKLLDLARSRTQQLRFLALTNWTISQKSMIHLSQLLELIETRGQGKTTYKPTKGTEGGGLVDRVA